MSDVIDKKQMHVNVFLGKNMVLKVKLVLCRCFWLVLMSILCVVVHVLGVYAPELLSGIFWIFWDKVWLFLVKTGGNPVV